MVDLLEQHHESGRRYEPNELVEAGSRVAVGLEITDSRWSGESAQVYKVFSFREDGAEAVLLEDCVDRDDALGRLTS
ncbi:MAG TPA: hypothetical protein VFA37_10450 [Gaiellaceae bacterium]|nr:hypothetical protein [Gaiellaceae bacterium]